MRHPWLIVPAFLLALAAARAADDSKIYGRTLSEWQDILGNGKTHPAAARAAGVVLGTLPSKPLLPKLTRSRRAALLVLEVAGAPNDRSLAVVAVALRDDPEEEVRAGAVALLGQWGSKKSKDEPKTRFAAARDAMILALKDPSGAVREAAAAAVGQLLPEDGKLAVGSLTPLLKDKHPAARLAAADSLRRLGKDAADAVPALLEIVKDRDAAPLLRMQTTLALGRVGAPDALPALGAIKDVLADAKAPVEVRKAAAETLGLFGKYGAEAAAQLGAALKPAEPLELRRAAMTALDKIGPDATGAVKEIKKAMRDDDRFVRCLAMHTLGQIGKDLDADAKEVVMVLIEALADGSLEVRVAAIETLGTLGREVVGAEADKVEKRLKELSKDTREAIRDAANAALKRFGDK
jgi:HEAT repeat protein